MSSYECSVNEAKKAECNRLAAHYAKQAEAEVVGSNQCVVLDGSDMKTCTALREVLSKSSEIFVPNCNYGNYKLLRAANLKKRLCTALFSQFGEWVEEVDASKPVFFAWPDYCCTLGGNANMRPIDDIGRLFARGLLVKRSVFAVTFNVRAYHRSDLYAYIVRIVTFFAAQRNLQPSELAHLDYGKDDSEHGMVFVLWRLLHKKDAIKACEDTNYSIKALRDELAQKFVRHSRKERAKSNKRLKSMLSANKRKHGDDDAKIEAQREQHIKRCQVAGVASEHFRVGQKVLVQVHNELSWEKATIIKRDADNSREVSLENWYTIEYDEYMYFDKEEQHWYNIEQMQHVVIMNITPESTAYAEFANAHLPPKDEGVVKFQSQDEDGYDSE